LKSTETFGLMMRAAYDIEFQQFRLVEEH